MQLDPLLKYKLDSNYHVFGYTIYNDTSHTTIVKLEKKINYASIFHFLAGMEDCHGREFLFSVPFLYSASDDDDAPHDPEILVSTMENYDVTVQIESPRTSILTTQTVRILSV